MSGTNRAIRGGTIIVFHVSCLLNVLISWHNAHLEQKLAAQTSTHPSLYVDPIVSVAMCFRNAFAPKKLQTTPRQPGPRTRPTRSLVQKYTQPARHPSPANGTPESGGSLFTSSPYTMQSQKATWQHKLTPPGFAHTSHKGISQPIQWCKQNYA